MKMRKRKEMTVFMTQWSMETSSMTTKREITNKRSFRQKKQHTLPKQIRESLKMLPKNSNRN